MFCDLTKEDMAKHVACMGEMRNSCHEIWTAQGTVEYLERHNCNKLYGGSVWEFWTDSNGSWVGRV